MRTSEIIFGLLSLVCLLLLVVKFPLRKLGFSKLNASLMKAHEGASAGFFFSGIVYTVLLFSSKSSVGAAAAVSAAVMMFISFVLIAACHMTKDKQRKMRDHRIFSLLLTLAAAVHCLALAGLI